MINRKIFQFCSKQQNNFFSNFYRKHAYFFAATASKSKPCPYKTLNVSTDATPEDIKKSYLELAKKYHPDVQTGETVQTVKLFFAEFFTNQGKISRNLRSISNSFRSTKKTCI